MFKLAVIGAKDSGKTTLVEKIIKKISMQDVLVMSIKHTSHHHKFDKDGKDSDRHRQAGSKLTVLTNPEEFAIYSEDNPKLLLEIEKIYSLMFDLCIIEGDKFSDIPKILLTRNIENINIENITGIIATYGDKDLKFADNHFLTDDIQQLNDFILKHISEQVSERTI